MRMPAFLVLALVCSVRGVPAAPLPGTTQPQQAVRAGRDIAPPTKLKDVKPVYPPIAVTARVQGVVVIEAIIGEDGKVRDARVLRGVPLLDQAALDAVKQWEYEPTLLNGVAVPVIVNVRATFTLSDSPAPPAAPSAEPPFDDLYPINAGRTLLLTDALGNVLDPKLSPAFAFSYADGLLSVARGPGAFSYVNRAGRVAFEAPFNHAGPFSSGLAHVVLEDRHGYIDTNGRIAVPLMFEGAEDFSEGMAAVKRDGKWGYIDTGGRFLLLPAFDIVRPFKDGLAGVAEMATRTPMTFKFRVIDRDGQTVVPGPFDNIGTFGNGVVGVSRGEKWGLIDAQGRAITPLIYDSIGTCREQRCEVQRGEQWGFIDIAGQLVIPAKYETVNAFEHGLAAVYEKTTDAAGQPVRNPRPFFIDRAGQVQFTGPASATPVIYRDVIYVESDTACGYIDRLGRVVVMAEQRGGRWVVVDTTGQVIWPAGQ